MKKHTLTTLALGTALGALIPVAGAANDNPFSAKALPQGYQLAQADTKKSDGKCGEAKCGGARPAPEVKKKDPSSTNNHNLATPSASDKKSDGKCGEAKCGAKK